MASLAIALDGSRLNSSKCRFWAQPRQAAAPKGLLYATVSEVLLALGSSDAPSAARTLTTAMS